MNAKNRFGAMPTLAVGMRCGQIKSRATLPYCPACPRQAWAWHPELAAIPEEAVA
jgi:hypothetical protein